MLSLRPKCKECNNESWVKGLCYKHYKKDNLKKQSMPKLPKHIEEMFDEKFPRLLLPENLDKNILSSVTDCAESVKSFIATILDEEKQRIIKLIKEDK